MDEDTRIVTLFHEITHALVGGRAAREDELPACRLPQPSLVQARPQAQAPSAPCSTRQLRSAALC
jgi:hypothetical protein